MSQANLTNTISFINKASTSDLNSIVDAVNKRRSAITNQASQKFSVGDEVCWDSLRADGAKVSGVIKKINRKTIIVSVTNNSAGNNKNGNWRVTPILLSKVK